MKYIIESDEGYWSNDNSWTENSENASLFHRDEKDRIRLPIGSNVRLLEKDIYYSLYCEYCPECEEETEYSFLDVGEDSHIECSGCHKRI